LSDGLFDIVLVGNASRIEFLRAFPSVFSGSHLQHPKVKLFRSRHVVIRSGSALPVLADGEEIGETPVEFEIAPAALSVLTPIREPKRSPIAVS
jgi:diacylglycerol kinase (ATP)